MRLTLLLLLTAWALNAYGQIIQTNIVCHLPSGLTESSGLTIDSDGNFWSMNDSSGEPELFHFDSAGQLLHSVFLTNAENIDWEELVLMEDQRMVIGDFGNNLNDRQDLRLLICDISGLNPGENYRSAEIVTFSYAEQYDFPPADEELNFDCEAMVCISDTAYLFTKNRTVPFTGLSYCYAIPLSGSGHSVARRDSFFVGADELGGRVTAAALRQDRRLSILATTNIIVFEEPFSAGFGAGPTVNYELGSVSQKEGIAWSDSCTIWFSDEIVPGLNRGAQLYRSQVCDTPLGMLRIPLRQIEFFPQPASEVLTIHLPEFPVDRLLKIFDQEGGLVGTIYPDSSTKQTLDVSEFLPGTYWVTGSGLQPARFIIAR